MALAPARQAGGRAARIADFWRISAVFDPICRGPLPLITVRGTRLLVRGSRPAGHDRPPAADGICAADHGQPVTVHGSRAGRFGTTGAGHGAASLTLLIGQRWPVTGIKKPPLVMHQRGRLSACAGLKRR